MRVGMDGKMYGPYLSEKRYFRFPSHQRPVMCGACIRTNELAIGPSNAFSLREFVPQRATRLSKTNYII